MLTTLFRRYLLPAIIFQSVLIGGGYATGREIVEFGGVFGTRAWVTILVIFAGFSLTAFLTYETARITRAYDYKTWIQNLIFGLWPLFDVLFVSMTILVLGVLSAATGSIAEEVLGLPFAVGAGFVLFMVALLNYYGASWIERFKTGGTLFLYAGYLVFGLAVVLERQQDIGEAFRQGRSPDTGFPGLMWTGLLYVGYNLAALVTTLFVLKDQKELKETVGAGLLTGLLATIPFALTWICLLGFYPDPQIMDAPVPWVRMLSRAAPGWVLGLYGLVVLWTLVETCTGLIHAILDRIDRSLLDLNRKSLSKGQSAALAASILILAGGLSRFGIIDLIARGYTAMSYGFLLLLAAPLLIVGTWMILKQVASSR